MDFITSPGHVPERRAGLLKGGGPKYCVTDLGLYGFDPEDGEMILLGMYEGVTLDMIRDNTGWEIRTADQLQTLPSPTEEERAYIQQLDPQGIFLGKSG